MMARRSYFDDYDSYTKQFGDIKRVEVQPHEVQIGTLHDTSGANGEVTMTNCHSRHEFEWDMETTLRKM